MSNAHSGSMYRRRLGRAPSPPTWLWYEQIPFADDSSESDGDAVSEYESCSEDDEDYNARQHEREHHENENPSSSASESGSDVQRDRPARGEAAQLDSADVEGNGDEKMDVDEVNGKGSEDKDKCGEVEMKKDVKGKQRAIDPPDVEVTDESTKRRERRKKQRKPVYTFRPILTIQKSQGFVWNQDLFVPPYIKDRYVASTSPPNAKGSFTSSSATSVNPCNEYEVDVVEIRVEEGEYADIIPSRGFSGDPQYR